MDSAQQGVLNSLTVLVGAPAAVSDLCGTACATAATGLAYAPPPEGLFMGTVTTAPATLPVEFRDLWADAHLVAMRWREFMEHPTCPILRARLHERVQEMEASAKRAHPLLEAHLKASAQ